MLSEKQEMMLRYCYFQAPFDANSFVGVQRQRPNKTRWSSRTNENVVVYSITAGSVVSMPNDWNQIHIFIDVVVLLMFSKLGYQLTI